MQNGLPVDVLLGYYNKVKRPIYVSALHLCTVKPDYTTTFIR